MMAEPPASLSAQDEGLVSRSSPGPSALFSPPRFCGKPGLAGKPLVSSGESTTGRQAGRSPLPAGREFSPAVGHQFPGPLPRCRRLAWRRGRAGPGPWVRSLRPLARLQTPIGFVEPSLRWFVTSSGLHTTRLRTPADIFQLSYLSLVIFQAF